jgi:serine/threonine protein kinase
MPFSVGTVVAGYRIERVLGAGGMGTVYLGQHSSLPRRDALKILSGELSHDGQFRARFLREANLAATLDHPNIVTVYDRGETPDGQLWIAMEFIDGTDASAELDDGRMTAPRAVQIITEVANALDYAHSRLLLHRDVKPANFLLGAPGAPDGGQERVWLADFGIARALDDATHLTQTGLVLATAAYAAPETVEGLPLDHRADVYSLGCALFRLLTGRTPYAEFTGMSAMMMAHVLQPIPRATQFAPWLPPTIDDVIVHALAKNRDQRFQSAGELAAAAGAALAGQPLVLPVGGAQTKGWSKTEDPPTVPTGPGAPVPARPSTLGPPQGWGPPPPKSRPRRRWWALGAATTAVAASIAVAVALTTTHADHAKAPPPSRASAPPRASSKDTGPVGIILVDPSCTEGKKIGQTLVAYSPLKKWHADSPDSPLNLPASSWTPEQREAMQRAATMMRDLADKAVSLAPTTPHRVMRELYEQAIAYARAWADSQNNYFPKLDVNLWNAADDAMSALFWACEGVSNSSIAARSVLVTAPPAPRQVAQPQDPANPQRFVHTTDRAVCGELVAVNQKYDTNPVVQDFQKLDHQIPANQWTPQQKAVSDAVAPVLGNLADDLERTGARGDNPVIGDFATFAAQYLRALAKALPTYGALDSSLGWVSGYTRHLIGEACTSVNA